MHTTTGGDFIEEIERRTGKRIDDPTDDTAMLTLFGALAREVGIGNHRPYDDFAAGVVVRHQISPRGRAEKAGNELLARMLGAGIHPDVINALKGK